MVRQSISEVKDIYSWQTVSYNKKAHAIKPLIAKSVKSSTFDIRPIKEPNENKLKAEQNKNLKILNASAAHPTNKLIYNINKNNIAPIHIQQKPKQTVNQQRRSRVDLRTVQQIKRAHRHLLTSGGKDKKQESQQRKKSDVETVENLKSTAVSQKVHSTFSNCKTIGAKSVENLQGKQKSLLLVCKAKDKNCSAYVRNYTKSKGNKNRKYKSGHLAHSKNYKKPNNTELAVRPTYAESLCWSSIEEELNKLYLICDESLYQYNFSPSSSSLSDSLTDDDDELYHHSYWSDIDAMEDKQETHEAVTPSVGNTSPLVPSALKRRGHQHHPRFSGTRRPAMPPNVQQILDAIYCHNNDTENEETSNEAVPTIEDETVKSIALESFQQSSNLSILDNIQKNYLETPIETEVEDHNMPVKSLLSEEAVKSTIKDVVGHVSKKSKRDKKDKTAEHLESRKRTKKEKVRQPVNFEEVSLTQVCKEDAWDIIDEGIGFEEDDIQSAEWAKLRCTSEAAEIVAERETRCNKGRCADYPGLAFGRSIFSSDTMMKFNIIRNELHNIMKTQLKRVNTKAIKKYGTMYIYECMYVGTLKGRLMYIVHHHTQNFLK